WATMRVRGTQFNMGAGLRMALEIGAQPFGNWAGAHATPISADAPNSPWGLGELTRRARYPYGVMVNVDGRPFLDEGEDIAWFTYYRFGHSIQEQKERLAFQIFDGKKAAIPFDGPQYAAAKPVVADTLPELAIKLGLDPAALVREIDAYNQACDETTP